MSEITIKGDMKMIEKYSDIKLGLIGWLIGGSLCILGLLVGHYLNDIIKIIFVLSIIFFFFFFAQVMWTIKDYKIKKPTKG